MKNTILTFWTFLLLFPFYLGAEKMSHYIEWKSVANVEKYRIVIIGNNSRIILKKDVTENFLHFTIKPGKYEFRVGILGKSGKLEKWSRWNKLVVKPLKRPEILSDKIYISLDKPQDTVKIRARYLTNSSTAWLQNGDKEVPLSLQTKWGKVAVLTVPTQGLENGKQYKMFFKNPHISPSQMKAIAIQGSTEEKNKAENRKIDKIKEPVKYEEPTPFVTKIIPAFTQYKNKRKYFGTVYSTMLVGGVAMAASSKQEYNAWFSYYKASSYTLSDYYYRNYLIPKVRDEYDSFMLLNRINRLTSAKSGLIHSRNKTLSGVALFGGIYLVNLIDNFFISYKGSGKASKVSRSGALWRSMLIPGWGQIASGRRLMGNIYFSSILALGVTAAGSQREYRAWRNYYSAVRDEYNYLIYKLPEKSNLEGLYLLTNKMNESNYVLTNLNNSRKRMQGATNGAALFYLWNVLDSVVFYGKTDRKTAMFISPREDGAAINFLLHFN